MIKNLPIQRQNEVLIQDFTKHLRIIGYQKIEKAPSGVRELLWRMEQEKKRLSQITSEDIKRHYQYLSERPNHKKAGGLSASTINNYLFILKLFFKYTEKTGLTKSNPMSVLSFPVQSSKERSILEKEEIKTLYKVCKTNQEKAILSLFYGCGLRKSEAEKLNTRDIDYVGSWLYIRSGKGRKRRVIPIAESVKNDFRNYQIEERRKQESRHTKPVDKKAFMLNGIGTRMRGNSYWEYFKRIVRRTEINPETSLHHLRHTIATHLLASGMSIEQVRDFLGHDHLESTQIYTRVNTNQLQI